MVAKFNPQLDGLLEEVDALDRAFREGCEDAPRKLQEFHNHLCSLRVSHGSDGFEQVWKVLDGDRKLKEFLKKLEEIDPETLAPSEIQDIEAQQAQLISMFRGKCKALKKAMTQFNRDYQKATGRSIKVAQSETDTEAEPSEAQTPSSVETELENIITTAAVGDESVGFSNEGRRQRELTTWRFPSRAQSAVLGSPQVEQRCRESEVRKREGRRQRAGGRRFGLLRI